MSDDVQREERQRRSEVTVRPEEVQRGDWIHLSQNQWVQVDQHGKDEWRSLFWCVGLYYPIAVDRGALVTVRRHIGRQLQQSTRLEREQ